MTKEAVDGFEKLSKSWRETWRAGRVYGYEYIFRLKPRFLLMQKHIRMRSKISSVENLMQMHVSHYSRELFLFNASSQRSCNAPKPLIGVPSKHLASRSSKARIHTKLQSSYFPELEVEPAKSA